MYKEFIVVGLGALDVSHGHEERHKVPNHGEACERLVELNRIIDKVGTVGSKVVFLCTLNQQGNPILFRDMKDFLVVVRIHRDLELVARVGSLE